MSFDINEPVFDEQGTYLEEPALRYEHALMEQFTASPEGQAITQMGSELGWAGAMIHYAIAYPGATPATMRSRLWPLPAQSHHPQGRRSGDYPRITGILALFRARLPVTASQADARTLDATGRPTPGAGVAGASQLWHGQVLCPDGKRGGV